MPLPVSRSKSRRSRAEVDAIVDEIVQIFARGTYVKGVTWRQLAEKHGVSLSMITQWATIASRVVAPRDEGALELLRAETISTLDRLARKAELWASAPDGDKRLIRDAITATCKAAEVGGVTFATPPSVNVLIQNGELAPEARAFVARASSALVDSAREVLADHPELLDRLLDAVERRMGGRPGPHNPAALPPGRDEVIDAEVT